MTGSTKSTKKTWFQCRWFFMAWDRWASLTKNFMKDEITGRVDIVWRIFFENCKKVKIEVTATQKSNFFECFRINWRFSDPVTSFFTFLHFSEICARDILTLPVILFFYKILCSSNFFGRTSPRCCSWGSTGGWIKISFLQNL